MKKVTFTLAIVLLSSLLAFAQNSGKGFNYQAIARDLNGQVLQNEMVILQFGLYAGQYVTEPTYQEVQLANTDEFGAFSLTVGHGQKNGGTAATYQDLDYGAADFWLKVELKDGSEFFEISFRELMSVPYAEVARNAMPNPVGTILPFAGPSNAIPDGYLLCNGASVDKNAYPALYAVIGNAWGGNTANFNLPDCRGNFLRGVDYGVGRDPDRSGRVAIKTGGNTGDNVGSYQYNATKNPGFQVTIPSHSHLVYRSDYMSTPIHWSTNDCDGDDGWSYYTVDAGCGAASDPCCGGGDQMTDTDSDFRTDTKIAQTVNVAGGVTTETRPINVYVNYIIKY